jgi:hypothetical protein
VSAESPARAALGRSWIRICEAVEIASTAFMARLSKGSKSGLISAGVVHGICHCFFWMTVIVIDAWTKPWFDERHPLSLRSSIRCVASVGAEVCDRLNEMEIVSFSRLAHHYEVSRALQCFQFGFLTAAFWSSTMFAMSVVMMIRKGFDDMGPNARGLILGSILSSAFFGGFPSLMSIDDNIESNMGSYNAYDGIYNEIHTYASTGQSVTGNHVDGSSFLHKLDLMFAALPAPRLQLDSRQVDVGKSRFFQLSQELEAPSGGRAASTVEPPVADQVVP